MSRDYLIGPPELSMHTIVMEVCIKHGLTWRAMMSQRRSAKIAHPRQEAYWRCINETKRSYPQVGRFFERDHTTILYGCRQHEKRLQVISSASPQSFNIPRVE